MKGLIIKDPWITKILDGQKPWEIRGSYTKHRGHTELIKSGTGKIFGSAELVESFPLTKALFETSYFDHRIPDHIKILYKTPFVWMFTYPLWHPEPIPYIHPQGAVIWVKLDRR